MHSPLAKLWVLALKPQRLFSGKEMVSLTVPQLALEPAVWTALLSSRGALHTHGAQNGWEQGIKFHFTSGRGKPS